MSLDETAITPVTYPRVAAVCELLRAAGGDGAVTVRAVRRRLGRGSMNTLLRHVRRWKAGGLALEAGRQTAAPSPDRLELQAVELQAQRLARHKAEAALALVEADQARAAAREEAALVEADRAMTAQMKAERRAEKLAAQLAGAQAELAAMGEAQDALIAESAALRDRAIAAEARLRQLEGLLDNLLRAPSAISGPANQP